MRSARQYFVSPLADAFSSGCGSYAHGSMDFRSYPQHEFARCRFLRIAPRLGAILEIVIDCLMKPGGQLKHGLTVEADVFRYTEHTSDENVVARIEFDPRKIPLIVHCVYHGFTSNSINHSRTSST